MFDYATAVKDFHEARRQARLEELFGRFTGQTLDLLAFDEVRKMLRASSPAARIPPDSMSSGTTPVFPTWAVLSSSS